MSVSVKNPRRTWSATPSGGGPADAVAHENKADTRTSLRTCPPQRQLPWLTLDVNSGGLEDPGKGDVHLASSCGLREPPSLNARQHALFGGAVVKRSV